MSKLRTFMGLAAVALLVSASSLAQAQYNGTWQPTGEANWTNPANWLDSATIRACRPSPRTAPRSPMAEPRM